MLPEDRIEKIIKEAVKANMRDIPEPDMDRIWAGIVRKARKRRAKKNAVRALALVVVAFFFAGVYSVWNPEPVRALGNALWYSFVTVFQDHSGTIQQSYTSDLGVNPPQQPHSISPVVEKSVAGAAARAPFKVMVPGYLPSGFKLYQVKYYPEGDGLAQVEMDYSSGNGWLIFNQWNAFNQGTGYSYDTDDTVVSNVTVRGNPGKLFYRPKNGGFSQLVWADGDLNYRIGGAVSPLGIQHVASSLRELGN